MMEPDSRNKIGRTRLGFAAGYIKGLKECLDQLPLAQVAELMGYVEEAYHAGRNVFIIGNGGSATTASHMACDLGKNIYPAEARDLMARFRIMALTDNVSHITALANDLGYEHIFSEQLKNLVQKDDLVIAISGSGNSPNILEGLKVAKSYGARTVGILGFAGGKAKSLVDACIIVESDNYGFIEDIHLMLSHLITGWLRDNLARSQP